MAADAFESLTGCATSIDNNQDTDLEDIIIYPNPASNHFTIYNIPPSAQYITVYNVLGKTILKKTVTRTQETVIINVPNGIYFCELNDGEKIISTKKFIVSE